MFNLSHKAKQYLLVALKLLILAVTFWYIYDKVNANDTLDWKTFIDHVRYTDHLWTSLFICMAFAIMNWIFEIAKWKTLVSSILPISFKTAIKQSLVALTVSLATPNRIGDYGAKAYFFESTMRKKVLLLNLFSNGAQMATTVLFGLVGVSIFIVQYDIQISLLNVILLIIVVIGFLFLGYLLRERQLLLKGFTLLNVWHYFKNLSTSVKIKTVLFSVLRYVIFSTLFLMLLTIFEAEITFQEAAPLIFGMYFLVSIIPTVFIFDVVVRGGVAVWLFSYAGVNELTVLSAVLAMWLLNFIVPALLGSVLMFTYKPVRS